MPESSENGRFPRCRRELDGLRVGNGCQSTSSQAWVNRMSVTRPASHSSAMKVAREVVGAGKRHHLDPESGAAHLGQQRTMA